MMLVSVVSAALVLVAASVLPSPDIVSETLRDFDRQGASPAEFRNVKLGLYTYRPDDRRPVLCGQFRPEGAPDDWRAFVSLDTHGYEHWTGDYATTFCQGAGVTLEEADWAPSMNEQLRSGDRSAPAA